MPKRIRKPFEFLENSNPFEGQSIQDQMNTSPRAGHTNLKGKEHTWRYRVPGIDTPEENEIYFDEWTDIHKGIAEQGGPWRADIWGRGVWGRPITQFTKDEEGDANINRIIDGDTGEFTFDPSKPVPNTEYTKHHAWAPETIDQSNIEHIPWEDKSKTGLSRFVPTMEDEEMFLSQPDLPPEAAADYFREAYANRVNRLPSPHNYPVLQAGTSNVTSGRMSPAGQQIEHDFQRWAKDNNKSMTPSLAARVFGLTDEHLERTEQVPGREKNAESDVNFHSMGRFMSESQPPGTLAAALQASNPRDVESSIQQATSATPPGPMSTHSGLVTSPGTTVDPEIGRLFDSLGGIPLTDGTDEPFTPPELPAEDEEGIREFGRQQNREALEQSMEVAENYRDKLDELDTRRSATEAEQPQKEDFEHGWGRKLLSVLLGYAASLGRGGIAHGLDVGQGFYNQPYNEAMSEWQSTLEDYDKEESRLTNRLGAQSGYLDTLGDNALGTAQHGLAEDMFSQGNWEKAYQFAWGEYASARDRGDMLAQREWERKIQEINSRLAEQRNNRMATGAGMGQGQMPMTDSDEYKQLEQDTLRLMYQNNPDYRQFMGWDEDNNLVYDIPQTDETGWWLWHKESEPYPPGHPRVKAYNSFMRELMDRLAPHRQHLTGVMR